MGIRKNATGGSSMNQKNDLAYSVHYRSFSVKTLSLCHFRSLILSIALMIFLPLVAFGFPSPLGFQTDRIYFEENSTLGTTHSEAGPMDLVFTELNQLFRIESTIFR